MSQSSAPPPPRALLKQQSWSPEMLRDQAWSRRKGHHHKLRRGGRLSRSVTDDDLDELKACFELGFGFDSPVTDPKLSDVFPALEFYHTVNKQYSRSLSVVSDSDKSAFSVDNCPSTSSTIFDAGDDPEMVKTRLRQWAQVVACVARQSRPAGREEEEEEEEDDNVV